MWSITTTPSRYIIINRLQIVSPTTMATGPSSLSTVVPTTLPLMLPTIGLVRVKVATDFIVFLTHGRLIEEFCIITRLWEQWSGQAVLIEVMQYWFVPKQEYICDWFEITHEGLFVFNMYSITLAYLFAYTVYNTLKRVKHIARMDAYVRQLILRPSFAV